MPIKDTREYRALPKQELKEGFIVEGYASTFEPYVMFEDELGNEYFERIATDAFNSADMSDVIFQRDHQGPVVARTSNGSIELTVDAHGLKQRSDLSRTSTAQTLYEDIAAEMYREMSFAFTVEQEHYDRESRTRVIDKIKKVYDVSAVSFGANPTTEIGISARDLFSGWAEEERQEMERRAKAELLKSQITNWLED